MCYTELFGILERYLLKKKKHDIMQILTALYALFPMDMFDKRITMHVVVPLAV